jgi:hypothetical protein
MKGGPTPDGGDKIRENATIRQLCVSVVAGGIAEVPGAGGLDRVTHDDIPASVAATVFPRWVAHGDAKYIAAFPATVRSAVATA